MYAVLSDVHSNLEALKSVQHDISKREITSIYVAGDTVGYGPEPDECLEILRQKGRKMIAGNHDFGAAGVEDPEKFNEYAKIAIQWTKEKMLRDNIKFLGLLPLKIVDNTEDITLVHSTPFEPEAWHYLYDLPDAEINFLNFSTRLCFVGHTHRPFIFEKTEQGNMIAHEKSVDIRSGNRYIINAGSVGQPRDHDARSSYAIVDEKHIEIVRVQYDIETTQYKMAKAGLPIQLINRLSLGM